MERNHIHFDVVQSYSMTVCRMFVCWSFQERILAGSIINETLPAVCKGSPERGAATLQERSEKRIEVAAVAVEE